MVLLSWQAELELTMWPRLACDSPALAWVYRPEPGCMAIIQFLSTLLGQPHLQHCLLHLAFTCVNLTWLQYHGLQSAIHELTPLHVLMGSNLNVSLSENTE